MKALVFSLLMVFTQFSSADIPQELNEQHFYFLSKSIIKSCGEFRNLKIKASESKTAEVFPGTFDVKLQTVLTGEQLHEEQLSIWDKYEIIISSSYRYSMNNQIPELVSNDLQKIFCKLK